MPTKGNNRYGAAGRKGVPASTLVAFLDHYTYDTRHGKRLNSHPFGAHLARQVRRWRHEGGLVSAHTVLTTLISFGFDLAWFHTWAKRHRKPITGRGLKSPEGVLQ